MIRIDHLAPGLRDNVLDSQRCFRAAMLALSHPGRLIALDGDLPNLPEVQPAAAGLLLSLLDQQTAVHLTPSRADADLRDWLHFHTDCRFGARPDDADFVWVGAPAELPALATLRCGDDFEPERSATVIVEVPSISHDPDWQLSGPGIRQRQPLAIAGLPPAFVHQWQAQHAQFPRGVDLLFACGRTLCGLPRTTRIEN